MRGLYTLEGTVSGSSVEVTVSSGWELWLRCGACSYHERLSSVSRWRGTITGTTIRGTYEGTHQFSCGITGPCLDVECVDTTERGTFQVIVGSGTVTPQPTTTPTRTATVAPTRTPTKTPTKTPTPTPNLEACVGDCDGSGDVGVNEIITLVNIALGTQPLSVCMPGDEDNDGVINIPEIITAVNNALNGCGG